jgi:Ca2+-binding RTX toxin-like protein
MATVTGTSGNDSLSGTSSNDTLNGLGGNDTLSGSGGTDFYDGGAGRDTLDLRAALTALTVNFATGTISGGFNGTFVNIERVQGGDGDDSFSGGAGAQNLTARGGSDTLAGGAGIDSLYGGTEADHFVFRESGSANADSIGDFTSGADKIALDATVMTALGASGNFAAGDARFWSSSAGVAHDADDRIIYETDTRQIWYDADGSGAGARQLIATLQVGGTLAAADIVVQGGSGGGGQTINGTPGNDSLVGGAGNDTISGFAGEDTLDGADGDDHLLGGQGADEFRFQAGSGNYGADVADGGDGDDFVSFDGYATSAVVIDLRAGTLSGGRSSGSATLISIENAIGGAFGDLLVAYDGTGLIGSQLEGRGGNDTLLGGLALDNLFGDSGDDEMRGGGGNDFLAGGTGADFMFGDAGDDAIELSVLGADSGNDTVDGGGGTDYLFYTGARSALVVDFVAGTISGGHLGGGGSKAFFEIENFIAGDGADRITGDAQANVLQGGFGSDTIAGGAGNDTIYGGIAENPFDQHEEISGGSGTDMLTGGGSADDFVFDVAPGVANADLITNFAPGSDEIVLDGDVHADAGPSGELTAGDARFWSSGTGLAHDGDDRVIYNSATGELWYDADGNGAGARQLIATLQGALGLAATDITIVDGSGGGGGQLINGTSGNDTLTGTAGNDTINGLGGFDQILAGATGGADVIDGGAHFDTLDFKAGATSGVTVDFAAGSVTGGSSGTISFTSIERVIGSDFADRLGGNAAPQTMNGGAGADTLWGGGGLDVLRGGAGADSFVYRETASADRDQVLDFASGTDRFELDDAAFGAIGAPGAFSAGDARFWASSTGAAHDADDRVLFDTTNRFLYYDADGNGPGEAQLIAGMQAGASVAAGDITVI